MKRTIATLALAAVTAAQAAPPTLAQVRIPADRSEIVAAVQFFHPEHGSTVFVGGVYASTCRAGLGLLYVNPLTSDAAPEPIEVLLSGAAYADYIARALCAHLKEAQRSTSKPTPRALPTRTRAATSTP